MDNNGSKWWRDESGIHVELEFPNVTDKEITEAYAALSRLPEIRQARIARLCFVEKKPIREAAQAVGISKSQAWLDIRGYGRQIAQSIKNDNRLNKQPVTLYAELLCQSDFRIQTLFNELQWLAASLEVLGAAIKRSHARLQANPQARLRKIAELKEQSKEIRILIEQKKSLISQLRNESEHRLKVHSAFGLCNTLAIEGKIDSWDYDAQVESIRRYLTQVIEVIKEEVADDSQKRKVFSRLADLSESMKQNNPDARA